MADDFDSHLQGETTTLCHCWRLTRTDGIVLRFTDHDEAVNIAGETFAPGSGLDAREARESLGLAAEASDVEGALSSDAVTEADIDAGLYDGARVETLLVNWLAPQQHRLLRVAVIGRIERKDGRFMAALESLTRHLERVRGRTVRRSCDAELGDARCRFDVGQAGYSGTGTVTAVETGRAVRVTGLEAFAAGWFSHGQLTWTSGANAGRSTGVADHAPAADGQRLVLDGAAAAVAEGDGFTIAAGCDRRFATCREKFSNILNFRGFPHLPGNDAAYGYVHGDMPMDGGPLVR
jgi:uncharacterized phage protein (TIGR02218 family)